MKRAVLAAIIMLISICSKGQSADIDVYSDKQKKIVTIVYSSPSKMFLDIKVFNEIGETVYTGQINEEKGKCVKIIDLGQNSKGTYTIRMKNDSFTKLRSVDF